MRWSSGLVCERQLAIGIYSEGQDVHTCFKPERTPDTHRGAHLLHPHPSSHLSLLLLSYPLLTHRFPLHISLLVLSGSCFLSSLSSSLSSIPPLPIYLLKNKDYIFVLFCADVMLLHRGCHGRLCDLCVTSTCGHPLKKNLPAVAPRPAISILLSAAVRSPLYPRLYPPPLPAALPTALPTHSIFPLYLPYSTSPF